MATVWADLVGTWSEQVGTWATFPEGQVGVRDGFVAARGASVTAERVGSGERALLITAQPARLSTARFGSGWRSTTTWTVAGEITTSRAGVGSRASTVYATGTFVSGSRTGTGWRAATVWGGTGALSAEVRRAGAPCRHCLHPPRHRVGRAAGNWYPKDSLVFARSAWVTTSTSSHTVRTGFIVGTGSAWLDADRSGIGHRTTTVWSGPVGVSADVVPKRKVNPYHPPRYVPTPSRYMVSISRHGD